MQQLRIAHKLWLSVLAIVALLVAAIGFAGYRTAKLESESDAASVALATRVALALRWTGLTETNAARTQAVIVSSDPEVERVFKDAMAATTASIGEVQKRIEAMDLSQTDRAQMARIAEARKTMAAARAKARQLKAAGQLDEAVAFINGTYNPASDAYLQTLRDFVQMQQQAASQQETITANARMATVQMVAAALGAVLLALVVGAAALIRSIQQPLAQANALAAQIASGDLSAHAQVSRGDEFGELLRALYAMSHSLGRMVQQVRQSTDSIATASSEIASGNNDLAQRTEQTSSNLASTASSMDSLTQAVRMSSENARQAATLAANASSVAQRGGDVVTQVVHTMQEIDASSKKIADIISVIDGIAFQTNILALNAAVEAARAGEQGRGFAVVASEVRSLAGRSAEAAKEIKGLISTSVSKVQSGTQLVTDAGTTMQEIVQSVRSVVDVIGEITAAASEQSTGIAEVNQSVNKLDQMTQQNAALVEESAAAAESLRDQAAQLADAVAVFKVGHTQRPGASTLLLR